MPQSRGDPTRPDAVAVSDGRRHAKGYIVCRQPFPSKRAPSNTLLIVIHGQDSSLSPPLHKNTKYCPAQPRAMGCGLFWGLTPVATHAHANVPRHRSRPHLREPVFTKPTNGPGRALEPLNTPPTTGSFNSPWPSMSGAGKRNRACERATPYMTCGVTHSQAEPNNCEV